MKTIVPVLIWDNGQNVPALYLMAFSSNVTLGVSANFNYSLLDENQIRIRGGSLLMQGEAYQQWSSDDEYAWDWIAQQLNLTITGDYIPPVPPEPETTTTTSSTTTEAPVSTTTTTTTKA